jgi:SAM-dependent methyltransferase
MTNPFTTTRTFEEGVQAAFDYIRMWTANHYHLNPAIQRHHEEINDVLNEAGEEALADLAPGPYVVWRNLNDALLEADRLRARMKELER